MTKANRDAKWATAITAVRLSEAKIQRAIFAHLQLRQADGVFAFHVPLGGWRSPTEAAIFKGLGVVAGVPDIIIIKHGRIFALELKTERGKLRPEQTLTMRRMEAAGVVCHVSYGLDDALNWLEREHILVGARI